MSIKSRVINLEKKLAKRRAAKLFDDRTPMEIVAGICNNLKTGNFEGLKKYPKWIVNIVLKARAERTKCDQKGLN